MDGNRYIPPNLQCYMEQYWFLNKGLRYPEVCFPVLESQNAFVVNVKTTDVNWAI